MMQGQVKEFIKAVVRENPFGIFLKEDRDYSGIRQLQRQAKDEVDSEKQRKLHDRVLEEQLAFRGKDGFFINRLDFELPRVYYTDIDEFSDAFIYFEKLNRQGFAPCLYINSGYGIENEEGVEKIKVKDKYITKINAHFFEFDDSSKEKQLEIIKSLPIEPSIINETYRGYHIYYLLKSADEYEEQKLSVKRFKDIQNAIRSQLHETHGVLTDEAICNPSREMRLPGFYNVKYEKPFFVKCVKINSDLRYTQQEICEAFSININNPSYQSVQMNNNKTFATYTGIREMVKQHLIDDDKIGNEYENKITCKCYFHDDNTPSAFISFELMWYYCSACEETSMPLEQVAEELGWDDVLHKPLEAHLSRLIRVLI